MNQRWRLLALWLLPIGVVLLIGWQVLSNGGMNGMSQNNGGGNSPTVAPRNAAVARMSYGRFLDYVEAGRITAVDIYDGGRNAVVEAVDPDLDNRVQRLRVDLPGLAPELINTLKEEGISFDVHPPKSTPPALGLLGNLLFPLLLIGSLIFLARRNSNMPGGPGQAMQFGKSKAKFMMEAETGVMFDDVAGVTEAKQELEEVVTFLKQPERFTSVGAQIHLTTANSGTTASDGAHISQYNNSLYINNQDSGTIQMYNNGGERLRIDGTGRVLIGAQRTYDSGTYYDDIVVNNSNTASGAAGGAGISLVCGATSYGGVIFSNGSSHGRGYMKYDMTDDQLVLGTQTVDRLMIEDSGNNGDVHIMTGNIVFDTSTRGIDFSAGSDGASTSNLLDEYEEGEYTPAVSSGQTLHGSYNRLRWTKIGRQVTITGQLVFNQYNTGSYDANLTIGLPYNNGDGNDRSEYIHSSGIGYFNTTGSSSPTGGYAAIGFYIAASSSTALVIAGNPNADSTIGNWVGSGSDIWVNLTYFTD